MLGLFSKAQFKGQVVVPDVGFYGSDAHIRLSRERRLISSVHTLAELSPKPRQAALLIEEKRARGARYEDMPRC